mgnify:CR=1 FL=1
MAELCSHQVPSPAAGLGFAQRAGCDGTPTGLGVDEFLGEIHPKILEVLYCVDDPLCLISHLPSRKDRLTNSDRASVTMENLQMAMLVWASRQKSDGIGTQIDDAGDRERHVGQRIACLILSCSS